MIETFKQLQNTAASEPLPGLPQKRRIWRGAKALAAYFELGGRRGDMEELITYLIADLGHLADAAEVDYEHAVEWGMIHLEAERVENE